MLLLFFSQKKNKSKQTAITKAHGLELMYKLHIYTDSSLTYDYHQQQIRQLASVELRKQIVPWWSKMEKDVCVNVKARLLEIILNEQE